MYGTWVDNISNFHDLRQELVERETETVDLPPLSRCFLLPRRVLCAAQPQIYRPICNLNEIVAEGNDGSTGGGRGGRVGAELVPPPLSLSPGSKTKAGQDPVTLEPPAGGVNVFLVV